MVRSSQAETGIPDAPTRWGLPVHPRPSCQGGGYLQLFEPGPIQSGPGDKAHWFIFGESDAPGPAYETLKTVKQNLRFTPGEPAGFQQRQLFTHHLYRYFYQQQTAISRRPLQGALIAALPEAQ